MNERLAALAEAARKDPELKAALAAAPTPADAVRIADEHGVPLTAADLAGVTPADLQDADLEVVGGMRGCSRYAPTQNPEACAPAGFDS